MGPAYFIGELLMAILGPFKFCFDLIRPQIALLSSMIWFVVEIVCVVKDFLVTTFWLPFEMVRCV
jgi:hypothetical protein